MKSLFEEIHRRHPQLSWAGWVLMLVGLGCVVGMLVDDRTVLGINPWVKPFKFSVSIGVFLWTIGWLIHDLRINYYYHRVYLGLAFIVIMFVEHAIILIQSFRGTTSHFNFETALDGALFGIMGLLIMANTLLVAFITFLFFRKKLPLSPAYLWGIRLGLLIFLLGSFEGSRIVQNMAHTVGAPDGGAGLPLLNWSTTHGDLRVAHFLGLHALQLLMLTGAWLSKYERPGRSMVWAVVLVAVIYTMVTGLLFYQATLGQPLIPAS